MAVALVLRALGLGDLLTAVPALRAIAVALPDHRRLLAAPACLAPLVDLLDDGWEVTHQRGLVPLSPSLPRPEVAINLHGRGPESHCVLAAREPERLVAFAHAGVPRHAGPVWRAGEHEVTRWCRMLEESGIPADPTRLDLPRPSLAGPPAARGATLLHPGAASAARRWPVERWASVARAERTAGRDVALTGSPAEAHRAQTIARAAGLPRSAVLAGRTTLIELVAAVAAADRVVCGDTGVAHLATALGTPSVVLFGPTAPAEWGPPPDRERHRVLWAGRRGDPHADRPDPGLLRIEVADVLDAVRTTSRDGRKPRSGSDEETVIVASARGQARS